MSLTTLRTHLLEGLVHALESHAPASATAVEHLDTGRAGELAAFFYLRRLGYVIVARDWKSARAPGDIDLIAWDEDTLCFVEVKTRTTREVATAESAVDEHKRKTLRRLAVHYIRQLPDGVDSRFDILSVYYAGSCEKQDKTAEIELYRGAFGWSDPS